MLLDQPDDLRKRARRRAKGIVHSADRRDSPHYVAVVVDTFDEEPEIAHHLQLRLAFAALLPIGVDIRVVERDLADAPAARVQWGFRARASRDASRSAFV